MGVWYRQVALGLCLMGCVPVVAPAQNDPFAGLPVLERREMTLTVLADPVPCVGAHGDQSCLVMQGVDGERSLLYDGIAGYDHVAGADRVLVVEQVTLDGSDPTLLPQDIGTILYRLVRLP